MGIIANTQPDTEVRPINPDGTVSKANSFSYDPTMGNVNTGTDTVAGQLDTILGKDNAYITRARTAAAEAANSRGLINSTMGAQAGEAAAIDAALPVATQDANTYSNQRLTNQQAANAAGQFGAAAENQAGQFNAGQANSFGIIKPQTAAQTSLIGAQGEQQRITQAQASEAQKALVAQQGEIQKQLQTADAATRERLQAEKAEIDKQILAQQGTQEQTIQGMRGTQAENIARIQAENQTALQELKGDQATNVIQIESEYKNLLQTNASATNLWTSMLSAMTTVANSATMDTAGKQSAIDNMTSWLRSGLGVIGGITGYDLGSLLNFTPA